MGVGGESRKITRLGGVTYRPSWNKGIRADDSCSILLLRRSARSVAHVCTSPFMAADDLRLYLCTNLSAPPPHHHPTKAATGYCPRAADNEGAYSLCLHRPLQDQTFAGPPLARSLVLATLLPNPLSIIVMESCYDDLEQVIPFMRTIFPPRCTLHNTTYFRHRMRLHVLLQSPAEQN